MLFFSASFIRFSQNLEPLIRTKINVDPYSTFPEIGIETLMRKYLFRTYILKCGVCAFLCEGEILYTVGKSFIRVPKMRNNYGAILSNFPYCDSNIGLLLLANVSLLFFCFFFGSSSLIFFLLIALHKVIALPTIAFSNS